MSITRKPAIRISAEAEAFISAAPDAPSVASHRPTAEQSSVRRPTKKKISLDIDRHLLQRIDDCAHKLGISRNAVLALAAARYVTESHTR